MRALCVLHDAFSSTGLIGDALRDRGWRVEEILVVPADQHHTPDVEFTFPDHRDYDLLVPMGAPWSAYDDAAIGRWLVPELSWLSRAVAGGGAVFGICFGAQALARALGGSVALSTHPEVGWTTVESRDPALVPDGPWFEWHYDAFTTPPGSVVLAENAAAVQAYRIGRSLAVQFHPEVTSADVRRWLDTGGAEELRARGVDIAAMLAETERQDASAPARAEALIDNYLNKIFAG